MTATHPTRRGPAAAAPLHVPNKTAPPQAGAAHRSSPAAAPLHRRGSSTSTRAAEPGSAPANTFYQSLPGARAAGPADRTPPDKDASSPARTPGKRRAQHPVRLYDENTTWSGIRPLSHGAPPQGSGINAPLQAVCFRLEGAFATAVVARQALLRQAADDDLEIARCLAHGVIDVLDAALIALRGLAAGSSQDDDTELRTDAVRSTAVRRTRSTARDIHRTLDQREEKKERTRRAGPRKKTARRHSGKTPGAEHP